MGTDTDTTIERPLDVELDLDRGIDLEALDDVLDRVVEGLRSGDLAFVVTAAAHLGPAVAVCLAAAGADRSAERGTDVAFALADLASDPATAAWSAGELLAAAVAGSPGALTAGSR